MDILHVCLSPLDVLMTPTPPRVREPVQVYLDRSDRSLLEDVANQTGLSRAEILRRGLRLAAESLLGVREPGSSLEGLVGALGDDPSLPEGPFPLSTHHDRYLYGDPPSDGPDSP
jgi:hypothetical protein